jgi:hypothetical protein
MDIRSRVKQLLKMCGHAFLSTLHERMDVLERQTQNASFPETQAALLQASIHTVEKLHELTDHVVVETHETSDPELGLMEFLYSYLPTRKAAVHDSRVAEQLRSTGYEVCLLGEGQCIPEDAGLVRLESGSGCIAKACAPVVAVTFRGAIESLIRDMRTREYMWHLVLHRAGDGKVAFYANSTLAIAESAGSVFFFREYGTFAPAQAWCAAVLPKTYFRAKAQRQ